MQHKPHTTSHTAVQASCIPPILQGRNVIGVAQTGSGKTAAFALPILQTLAADRYGVFCLVMTPTRYIHICERYLAEHDHKRDAQGAGVANC